MQTLMHTSDHIDTPKPTVSFEEQISADHRLKVSYFVTSEAEWDRQHASGAFKLVWGSQTVGRVKSLSHEAVYDTLKHRFNNQNRTHFYEGFTVDLTTRTAHLNILSK